MTDTTPPYLLSLNRREDRERLEHEQLSPIATKVSEGRGREQQEPAEELRTGTGYCTPGPSAA